MELYLINNDPTRTLLVTADGGPLFSIETPVPYPSPSHYNNPNTRPTVVTRFERNCTGHVKTEVGRVDCDESVGAKVTLSMLRDGSGAAASLDIVLQKPTEMENSWSFTGPDNRPYKWQIFIHYPILLLNDNSQTPLARYRRAKLGIISRSRRAFLEILPAGINVIDFAVVTFVTFMKQRMSLEHVHSYPSS